MLLSGPGIGLLRARATTLRPGAGSTADAASLRRRELERHHGIGRGHVARGGTAAAGGDDDILRAVFAHVGNRRRVSVGGKLRDPEFLASLRIECTESPIDGRADEDETAGRRDAAADVA